MTMYIILFAVICVIGFAIYRSKQSRKTYILPEIKPSVELLHGSSDRFNDPDVIVIRDEIRNAVSINSSAISVLQAIARMDGSTSENDRNLIFDFMNRNGACLSYEKHRPWFYTSRSGEWYRAATMKEFENIIAPLETLPINYLTDVYSTASAIVTASGTPKKREVETLERLRSLISSVRE